MAKMAVKLPESVDFLELLETAIEEVQQDGSLDKQAKKALLNLQVEAKELLADAIKIAATDDDGLRQDEIDAIIRDVSDLIHAAKSHKTYKKMLADPANPKWALSPDVVDAIKLMTTEEQNLTYLEFHELRPNVGEKILAFFEGVGRALLPVLKVVAAKVIEIGASILADLASKNIKHEEIKEAVHDLVEDSGSAISGVILPKEVSEEKESDISEVILSKEVTEEKESVEVSGGDSLEVVDTI